MKVFLIKVIGFFHHSAYPANVVRHSGVNPKFPSFPASFAETGYTKNGPRPIRPPRILAQKWTSAIPCARIHFPATIPGAEHVIGDSVVYVNISACLWRYYRYLKIGWNFLILLLNLDFQFFQNSMMNIKCNSYSSLVKNVSPEVVGDSRLSPANNRA